MPCEDMFSHCSHNLWEPLLFSGKVMLWLHHHIHPITPFNSPSSLGSSPPLQCIWSISFVDNKSSCFTCSFTSPVTPTSIAPYKKDTGPLAEILRGLPLAGTAELIFLHFPVSQLPRPQQFLCTNTLVPQEFCHVMPSNFNEKSRATILHNALKIWALCFIPDTQSIFQAQSLAWPAFSTNMLF